MPGMENCDLNWLSQSGITPIILVAASCPSRSGCAKNGSPAHQPQPKAETEKTVGLMEDWNSDAAFAKVFYLKTFT